MICYGGNPNGRNPILDYVKYIDSQGVKHTEPNNLNFYWDFDSVEKENYDWLALRNQAAIAAMQGMLANPELLKTADWGRWKIEQQAVLYANALVEQLKTKKK